VDPRYERAMRYLNEGLIRTVTPEAPNPRNRRQWMEWFLPQLGEPQRGFEAIHVAGTSGKGSVTMMLAEALREAGIHTGLHVSPYLQVATEKLWINGRYASAAELDALVEWVRPSCEANRGPHVPLHGLASVAIFLEHFARQRVELAVVEAGVGARNDLTNVLRTRVAVITALGIDHIKTLGGTLESIAWHKAGVIRPGCRSAVALAGPAISAARAEAEACGVPLRIVERGKDFDGAVTEDGTTTLNFRGRRFNLSDVLLGMPGRFQAENAALALAALEELGQPYEAQITEEHLRAALGRARLPGRLELLLPSQRNPCPVLLDGAHNPDKLDAMLSAVEGLPRRRLHVVYGALGSRAPDAQVHRLAKMARSFTCTQPRVYQKTARPGADVASLARGYGCEVSVVPDAQIALETCLNQAEASDLVLVTGSLYLCGEVRERWYPAAEVVTKRSSWF
jgi:dihydrofolate synthase / folylpolyglutamate synthase